MNWIEAQGTITADKKLSGLLSSSLAPGEYRVTLLIKEPANPNFPKANTGESCQEDVTIKTIKTQAVITYNSNLTAQLSSDVAL